MIVRDCHLHDIPSIAAFFKGGATGCLVERLLVERAQMGLVFGGNTDIEFHDTTVNPDYYQAVSGAIRNCVIKDTWNCGIGYFSTRDCKAYNNTLINCGNTREGVGIFIGLDGAYGTDGNPLMPPNRDVLFMNNVVIRRSGDVSIWDNWLIYFRGNNADEPAIPRGELLFDHNRYWDPHHPDSFHVGDRNDPASGTNYFSFDEWRSLPLHRELPGDEHSWYGDPLLDSAGAPAAGSSCRASGVAISALQDDFYGRERGDLIDIGAIQVSGLSARIRGLHGEAWSRSIQLVGKSIVVAADATRPCIAEYTITDLHGRTVRQGHVALSLRNGAGVMTAAIPIDLIPGIYMLECAISGRRVIAARFALHSGL